MIQLNITKFISYLCILILELCCILKESGYLLTSSTASIPPFFPLDLIFNRTPPSLYKAAVWFERVDPTHVLSPAKHLAPDHSGWFRDGYVSHFDQ